MSKPKQALKKLEIQVSAELHDELKLLARLEHRTIEAQVLVALDRLVAPVRAEKLVKQAKERRQAEQARRQAARDEERRQAQIARQERQQRQEQARRVAEAKRLAREVEREAKKKQKADELQANLDAAAQYVGVVFKNGLFYPYGPDPLTGIEGFLGKGKPTAQQAALARDDILVMPLSAGRIPAEEQNFPDVPPVGSREMIFGEDMIRIANRDDAAYFERKRLEQEAEAIEEAKELARRPPAPPPLQAKMNLSPSIGTKRPKLKAQ